MDHKSALLASRFIGKHPLLWTQKALGLSAAGGYIAPRVLRNNPIGSILVSVFFLLALFACWFSVRYFFALKEDEAMKFRIMAIQGTMSGMQQLVNETIEYGKKNPDVDTILLKFNLKTPPASAPTR